MFSGCGNCKFNTENEIKRLSDLNLDEEGSIFFIAGSDTFRKKVMELGFTKGTKVKILKKSPLNDPVSVFIREYEIIMKKKDIDLILVNKLRK